MKTFKLAIMLALTTILGSCDWTLGDGGGPPYFDLALSFQDTSGKDLVKGIAYIKEDPLDLHGYVDQNSYWLCGIEGEREPGKVYPFNTAMYYNSPELFNENDDEYHRLSFSTVSSKSKVTFTFLLNLPHVFGDNTKHEIVAYCNKKRRNHAFTYDCYRLVFDGKDIETTRNGRFHYADIILN
ncbi:MAG: hypothetical protein LBV32_01565 [Tannerellaceae bacterium]|jgi:hypothetical protein|nr:hypothetical protein [Tannerellaceae bacterium]